MKKGNKTLLLLVLMLISSKGFSQGLQFLRIDTKIKTAKKYMAKEKYKKADSLYTSILEVYKNKDIYYNRAIARGRLMDEEGFCIDLRMASKLGDFESRKRYKTYCIETDTFYFNSDSMNVAYEEGYYYYIIVDKHLYDDIKGYTYIDEKGEIRDRFLIDHGERVDEYCEQMPLFADGTMESLMSYIAKNTSYPKYARDNNIEGRVICSFEVDTNGLVSNCQVVQGVHESLNEEAVRVIHSLPVFMPGEHKGKKLKATFYAPIKFSLN